MAKGTRADERNQAVAAAALAIAEATLVKVEQLPKRPKGTHRLREIVVGDLTIQHFVGRFTPLPGDFPVVCQIHVRHPQHGLVLSFQVYAHGQIYICSIKPRGLPEWGSQLLEAARHVAASQDG